MMECSERLVRPDPMEVVAAVRRRAAVIEQLRAQREQFLESVAVLIDAGWSKGADGPWAPARVNHRTSLVGMEVLQGDDARFELSLFVQGEDMIYARFDTPEEILEYVASVVEQLSTLAVA